MQSLHNTTYPEEKSLMPDAVVGDSEAPAPIPGNTSERVTIPGGVKDEALKNLIMSWYYTGYYTGLYEGQQQAQHSLSS